MQGMSVCRSQLRHLAYPHVVDISRQLRKHIFHVSVHVVLVVASELYRRGSYMWWWRVLRQSVQQRLFVGVSDSCLQRTDDMAVSYLLWGPDCLVVTISVYMSFLI